MSLKDWLAKGAKPDETQGDRHPLASEAGMRRLQQALAGLQPAAQLDQLGDALESGPEAGLDGTAMRRALRMLDGGALRAIASLHEAMLREARNGQVPELHAAAMVKYCRRLGALIERTMGTPAAAQESNADLLLAARAMRAWVMRKKLLRMAYRFPDEEFWSAGNRLAALAAQRGLADAAVEIYPGEGASSLGRERLIGLMFDVAPTASITPVQMECLDQLLRLYAAAFVEGAAPAPDKPFYVDTARPQPPQRWLPGLPVRPGMRFFGPGECAAKIAGLAAEAKASGTLPAWAQASGITTEAFRLLLAMLGRHWSDRPPQRRDRRSAASANVFLVNGFEDVRRALSASEEAIRVEKGGAPEVRGGDLMRDDKYFERVRFGSVNPDKTATGKLLRRQLVMPRQVLEKQERAEGRPAPESSTVSDTSESGVGIALPGRAPWARVGVLVGYRAPDSLQWEVAVVRRLVRGARLSIGLERLRGTGLPARLAPLQVTEGGSLAGEALLLGDARQLIVPERGCAEGESFAVTAAAGPFKCRVARIIERGPDYVRAEYEILPG